MITGTVFGDALIKAEGSPFQVVGPTTKKKLLIEICLLKTKSWERKKKES